MIANIRSLKKLSLGTVICVLLGLSATQLFAKDFKDYRFSGPYQVKNLSVYLIHGKNKLNTNKILTLAEAMKQGKVKVHETGNVNVLQVQNLASGFHIFIQGGDIVRGGKQDRVISQDVVLKPGMQKVSVPAYCVEQGRWSKRGKESLSQFASSNYAISSREMKLAVKSPAAAKPAPAIGAYANTRTSSGFPVQSAQRGRQVQYSYGGNRQSMVWDRISKVQTKMGKRANGSVKGKSASSYLLSLDNPKVKKSIAQYKKRLNAIVKGKKDVVGLAFAVNGKLNSVDVYASNDLFMKLWPKMAQATSVEAWTEYEKGKQAKAPSVKKLKVMIANSNKGKRHISRKGHYELKTFANERSMYYKTEVKDEKSGKAANVHLNLIITK